MKGLLFIILCAQCVFSVYAQKDQNSEINTLHSGNYSVHKSVEKSSNNYRFETASKPWPVTFNIEGNKCKEILIKRAGVIDEKYTADLENFPAYYFNSSSEIVVSIIDERIYYYKWSIKTGSEIVYILSEKPVGNYAAEKSKLDDYRRTILPLQNNARQERAEEKDELAEEERKKNTLEGKSIQSIHIKLIDNPTDIGLLSIVRIGVEVTLSNGDVLKTKNLGGNTPYTDFDFKVSGGVYAGGDFKVANDSREIPNNRIEITATSKFGNSNVPGKLSIPINYKSDIFYQYQGKSGQNGRGATVGISKHGGDGTNGRQVTIEADLQTINGELVNVITILDSNTGDLLAQSKLHVNNKITVNVNGGSGGSGADGRHTHDENGGNGGNGGDAGNVLLSGSGSGSLNITVLSSGGKGGAGGKGKTSLNNNGSSGSSGSDGNLIRL